MGDETTRALVPCVCALDHPALGLNDEATGGIPETFCAMTLNFHAEKCPNPSFHWTCAKTHAGCSLLRYG